MSFAVTFFNLTNIINYELVYGFVSTYGNYSSAVLEDSVNSIYNIFKFVSDNWCSPILFTDLQTTLLTVFLSIIFANIILIAYFWSKFGGVITDRFIRPSEYFLFKLIFSHYTLC